MACSSTRKAFTELKCGHHPELEAAVKEFKEQQSKCISVTAEVIEAKAREIVRLRGIPHLDF